MVFASEQSTRAKVNEVFQQASSVGLSVCRTWAFNDGQYQAPQKSPSVYDENVFKYDIRLILSLVNNWNDYGGKAQYVKWGKDAGLNLSFDDDFFSDSTLKTYYISRWIICVRIWEVEFCIPISKAIVEHKNSIGVER
ncbi:Mannan endo-1 4-beta-mannosidase 6 [Bienertia sinuspersici]